LLGEETQPRLRKRKLRLGKRKPRPRERTLRPEKRNTCVKNGRKPGLEQYGGVGGKKPLWPEWRPLAKVHIRRQRGRKRAVGSRKWEGAVLKHSRQLPP
jgi:hypothetical protein